MSKSNTHTPAPRMMPASAADFRASDRPQQFVSVPQVEHVLVEQPVTYKQYKTKTTYVQVPVPQKYSKMVMNPQQAPMQAPRGPHRPDRPNMQNKPVYGCSAGPYQSNAYQAEVPDVLVEATEYDEFGNPVIQRPPVYDEFGDLVPHPTYYQQPVMNPAQYYYQQPPLDRVQIPRTLPNNRANSYAALY